MKTSATPIRIGSHTVRNRITFAPTVKFDWTDTSGVPTPRFARHYEERAEGGTGLIVVEATCVSPTGRLSPSQLGLWSDEQIAGHRLITDACHRHGSVVLVQIHHAGYGTHPACGPRRGPSEVDWRNDRTEAMSVQGIETIVQLFGEAAQRAKAAGYDGVQLHACHGYLINQFVSPRVNLRTDAYGGSTENRARFGCDIIRAIRKVCGPDFLISARTTGAEPTIEEAQGIAEAYVAAGADYLQVSGGIGPEEIEMPEGLDYGWIPWSGTWMHQYFQGRVPVSVVCGILKPELANRLLDEDLADTVDSARALLADPAWALAVTDGTPYVPCRACGTCLWSPHMPHKCPAVAERHKTNPDCVDYQGG